MLLRLLGSLLFAAPVVEIDARQLDGADDVTGRVLERSLEAGFTLGPDAPHQVKLRTADGGIEVVLRVGEEQWAQRVSTAGRDPELVRLEVAQHVVAMVQAHAENAPLPEGAVRLLGDGLEERGRGDVLLALVDAGVAVTDEAERVACVAQDAEGVRVAFGDDEEVCAQRLEEAERVAELAEGVATALEREQAETWEEHWPESETETETEAETETETETEVETEVPVADADTDRHATHRWGPMEGLVLIDGGITVRPEVAGRFGAGAIVGRRIGIIGTVEVGATPTRGDLDFRVLDTSLTAGVGWRWALGERARISVLGVAGVRLHTYGFAGQPAETAADASLATPLRLEWRPTPRVSLGIRIAPAFDGRSRRHVTADRDVWRRGPWRLDVGLSFGVVFGISD